MQIDPLAASATLAAWPDRTFLTYSEDSAGFPRMDFEYWYQIGLDCYAWRLPAHLVRQTFRHFCASWRAKGKAIAMWQVRAFAWGCRGGDAGHSPTRVAIEYQWPCPPDPSWELIVCAYPDGACELDFVHPVSRRFWSEDNDFFELPVKDGRSPYRNWFETMGFDVMRMFPAMRVTEGHPSSRHLALVSG